MPLRPNFSDLLKIGIFSGLISGFVLGILVSIWNLPLILEAEKFESKQESFSEVPASGHSHAHSHSHGKPHSNSTLDNPKVEFIEQDAGLWQIRNLGTVLGAILLGVSFGILFSLWSYFFPPIGFLENSDPKRTAIYSLIFASFGFFIFFGIPFLGLPPELPGRASGALDYPERQAWWYFCVLSNLAGVLGFQIILSYLRISNISKRVFAGFVLIFFILFPFYVGVPKLTEDYAAPLDLRIKFEYVTFATNLIFWSFLSSLFFLFWKRRLVA
ncbi:CbtA family protein [Leptospira sarikeiensis]|uniref:Cobalt transporter n=1 Tax=Leptospira sarikeiensis TaxID=2484943 RepID=A0A4R9K124_9LEPT|nr:CbtA family protein [Leptospira sarikeiensis]TGL58412.1 cobalt transporter [Leptospira sarikeiensis]